MANQSNFWPVLIIVLVALLFFKTNTEMQSTVEMLSNAERSLCIVSGGSLSNVSQTGDPYACGGPNLINCTVGVCNANISTSEYGLCIGTTTTYCSCPDDKPLFNQNGCYGETPCHEGAAFDAARGECVAIPGYVYVQPTYTYVAPVTNTTATVTTTTTPTVTEEPTPWWKTLLTRSMWATIIGVGALIIFLIDRTVQNKFFGGKKRR